MAANHVQPRKRKTKWVTDLETDAPERKQRKISIAEASKNLYNIPYSIRAVSQIQASLERKRQLLSSMRLHACDANLRFAKQKPLQAGLQELRLKNLDKGNSKTAHKYTSKYKMLTDFPDTQFTTLPGLAKENPLPELQQLDSMCGNRRNMSLGILSDVSTSRIAKAQTNNGTPFSLKVQSVACVDRWLYISFFKGQNW